MELDANFVHATFQLKLDRYLKNAPITHQDGSNINQPKKIIMSDNFPRRNRLDLNVPAELAIRNAMQEVEK